MKLLRFMCLGILFILVFVVGGRFYAMFSSDEDLEQNESINIIDNKHFIDETTSVLQESPSAARYCFLQQFNDMCMMAPMINLHLLESFLKDHGSIENVPEDLWLTRRQWFGKAHPYLAAWHSAFKKTTALTSGGMIDEKWVSKPDSTVENIYKFIEEAVEHGPVTPHYYRQNGSFFFTGKQKIELGYLQAAQAAKFLLTPYLFIDINAMRQIKSQFLEMPTLGLYLPIVRASDDQLYVFSQAANSFDRIENPADYQENYSLEEYPLKSNLTKLHTDRGFLDELKYSEVGKFLSQSFVQTKALGFKQICWTGDLATGISLGDGEKQKQYTTYMFGLYKLMLLSLGVDSNNQDIDNGHELYPVYQELRALNNEDPKFNLWSDQYFSKDKFLTYQIARLLDEDENLRESVKATVNFSELRRWSAYSDFLKAVQDGQVYRDREGQKPYVYDEVMKYIPGETQALASILMNQIRYLWYGTLNKKAYYEFTVPQENLAVRLYTKFKKLNFTTFKKRAFKKVTVGEQEISFIDVWQGIVEQIQNKFDRQHWISFDDHGWVVSFDEKLIEAQRVAMHSVMHGKKKKLQEALALLDALRCTGIESSHSSLLNSFYVKRLQD